ncbi:MAG: 50S ribosomal protein L9 [Chitinivibrionales bacterium]|nr:50S ribosomal protein L9 [Chitinivibrionales bacterium]
MEIILKTDHEGLGNAMDVINVKDGYARNFLIPKGIAVAATDGNRNAVAEAKRIAEKRETQKSAEAQGLAQKISRVPCTIPVKIGENEKIFGSVGQHEITDFLSKEGFDIKKSQIELEEPIKQLGVYNIGIKLYKDVAAELKVWVVKEEADQAKSEA